MRGRASVGRRRGTARGRSLPRRSAPLAFDRRRRAYRRALSHRAAVVIEAAARCSATTRVLSRVSRSAITCCSARAASCSPARSSAAMALGSPPRRAPGSRCRRSAASSSATDVEIGAQHHHRPRRARRHRHRGRREARQPDHDRPQLPHRRALGDGRMCRHRRQQRGRQALHHRWQGRAHRPYHACATTSSSLGTSFISHSITKPGVYSSGAAKRRGAAPGGASSAASSASIPWPSACAPSNDTWAWRGAQGFFRGLD